MLTPMDILQGNLLAFTAAGKLTDDDYKKTLIPAVQEAVEKHGKVRLLMHFGPDYQGFTMPAAFDDAMLGLKNIQSFTRVAVVTDNEWYAHGIRFSAHFLPYELRAFAEAEMEEAKKWING